MDSKKWSSLKKTAQGYTLDPKTNEIKATAGVCNKSNSNLTHLAFDETGERLLAVDSRGLIALVELGKCMRYRWLGRASSCTFVSFNPANRLEMLLGSVDGDIKIQKINGEGKTPECSLKGHKFPVKHVSNYKGNTLTCSSAEVIIWDLTTCSKLHQLRFTTDKIVLRKAGFSPIGCIAALYKDCTLQVWEFQNLEQDVKIDAKVFGLRAARDFQFTRDGRALILAGIPNSVIILNTFNWDLIKRLQLPDSLTSVKELGVLPQPLDGGANKILAVLSSSRNLQFLDLSTASLVPLARNERIVGASEMQIAPNGRFIAYVDIGGCLRLELADTLLVLGRKPNEKVKTPSRARSHGAEDHLSCVRRCIKEELGLQRLLPILKEFREYPRKHRTLIWSAILDLPRNRNAYAALANKSAQPGFTERILAQYPLADKSRSLFLAAVLNCLIHWCPLLSQSPFLPRFIFPFLIVFQGNHLLAFEIVIFLLSNYCQRWFEYHPLPPLNVLATLENVLSEADPLLLNYFCERGVTSSEYIWPLLQTAMSEVLDADEWLILWDHLFSSEKPSLLLFSAVAYSICSRQVIMAQLQSPDDFGHFYHAQGHVRVMDLLRVARQLDRNTPYHLHPMRYFRSTTCPLPKDGPYPSLLYDQYPKFMAQNSQLDLQQLRRQEERAIILRRDELCRMKVCEENILRMESEKFLREVDAARTDEIRRCYEAKIRNDELGFKNIYKLKENPKCQSHYNSKESRVGGDDRTQDEQQQDNNCQKLQEQVQKLEFEVQTLLQAVDSSATTQTTICK